MVRNLAEEHEQTDTQPNRNRIQKETRLEKGSGDTELDCRHFDFRMTEGDPNGIV